MYWTGSDCWVQTWWRAPAWPRCTYEHVGLSLVSPREDGCARGCLPPPSLQIKDVLSCVWGIRVSSYGLVVLGEVRAPPVSPR